MTEQWGFQATLGTATPDAGTLFRMTYLLRVSRVVGRFRDVCAADLAKWPGTEPLVFASAMDRPEIGPDERTMMAQLIKMRVWDDVPAED